MKKWCDSESREYPCSWNGLIRALRDLDLLLVAKKIETALKCVVRN